MKTMRLNDFRAELLATGCYRSHPECLAPKRAKPSAWTTFRLSHDVMTPFRMCPIYEMLGILDQHKWAELCFAVITGAEKLGISVTLEGWNNRRDYKGPVVCVCNHMSILETVLLPPVLLTYGPLNIIAKMSITSVPYIAKACNHMGVVGISRTSPREDLVKIFKVGTERIAAGNSFLIFPQGTRQKVFSHAKFSSIGAKLAERAGCPILPVVIDSRCQPVRTSGIFKSAFKDLGPVDTSHDIRCCCGPIIPLGRAKDMHEASFEWMSGKLAEWGLSTEGK